MTAFAPDTEHAVNILFQTVSLNGILYVPSTSLGVVIFAHGSGSSRLSPRNQEVAHQLQQAAFATLLFDLLTPEEEAIDTHTGQYRFNIGFLAKRLMAATDWLLRNAALNKLPIGYFGASTGGGAALMAAAQQPDVIKAIVSRGGRPDLAGECLFSMRVPTLLIVGGLDEEVIVLNKQAYAQLNCEKRLEIVPNATHLFEEPGKLDEVSRLAINWFNIYCNQRV